MRRKTSRGELTTCTMGDPVVLLVDTKSEETRAGVVMVERLWSRLPEELVEKILTWLPLSSLFRCRSVCKKWNTLMFSKDFHSTEQGSSQMPLLLLFGLESGRGQQSYDAVKSCWNKLPRTFLPYADVHPLVSAGGLILCVRSIKQKLDYSCLFVCNPLMKSWRDLPVTTRFRTPMLVSMVYDRHATSFKVIVAGDSLCCRAGWYQDGSVEDSSTLYWHTNVYDSATDSWRDVENVPEGAPLRATSAALSGSLYCLRRTGEMLKFDLERGIWCDMKLLLPASCDVACLTESCGAVYLAGYSKHRGVQSMRIWFLNLAAYQWVEVGILPQEMCAELLNFPKNSVRLLAQGSWVFMMFGGLGGKLPKTLKYDFIAKVWHHINDCPFDIRCEGVGYTLLPYVPRLDVFW